MTIAFSRSFGFDESPLRTTSRKAAETRVPVVARANLVVLLEDPLAVGRSISVGTARVVAHQRRSAIKARPQLEGRGLPSGLRGESCASTAQRSLQVPGGR